MPSRNIRRGATIIGDATGAVAPIYVDSDDDILKFIPAGSGTTEVQIVDASSTQTLTNKTLTSPTIAAGALSGTLSGTPTFSGAVVFSGNPVLSGNPDFTGDPKGVVVSKTVAFIENGSGTSYVGTVPLPAGATLHNIQFASTVLWDGTSASLTIGDDDDADGYFAATNLKATDLLVGEVLDITNAENWGGNNGAYLVAATGRKGQATADASGFYYTTANNIIATITPGAADGSAGRSFMTVTYSVGEAIAQVAT